MESIGAKAANLPGSVRKLGVQNNVAAWGVSSATLCVISLSLYISHIHVCCTHTHANCSFYYFRWLYERDGVWVWSDQQSPWKLGEENPRQSSYCSVFLHSHSWLDYLLNPTPRQPEYIVTHTYKAVITNSSAQTATLYIAIVFQCRFCITSIENDYTVML